MYDIPVYVMFLERESQSIDHYEVVKHLEVLLYHHTDYSYSDVDKMD